MLSRSEFATRRAYTDAMPSSTEWQKLPDTWPGPCACKEKAVYRNREKFSSGEIGVWQYFCETDAIRYNGFKELPEMPMTPPGGIILGS
jgi:hypothetical protein